MAGKRIPDLDPLSGAASANDDKLVIYDASTTSTKRIDRSQLAAGIVGDLPFTPTGFVSATTIPTAVTEIVTDISAAGGSALVGFLQAGTSAVTRTAQSKMRDTVSVLDFGAVGDGVTNDYQAIRNALDSLPPLGGTLWFPATASGGVYYLAQGLIINRPVRMIGQVATANITTFYSGTVLKFAASTTGLTFNAYNSAGGEAAYGANYSVVENIAVASAGGSGNFDGILIRAASIKLKNVWAFGFPRNGIRIRAQIGGGGDLEGNANLWSLIDISSQLNGSDGLYVDGNDSNAGSAINVNCSNNGGYGIYDSSFLGNAYLGCHVDNNTGGAYKTDNANAQTVFIGCYTEPTQGAKSLSSLVLPTIFIGGLGSSEANISAASTAFVMGGGGAYRKPFTYQDSRGATTIGSTLGFNDSSMSAMTFGAATENATLDAWKLKFDNVNSAWFLQFAGSVFFEPIRYLNSASTLYTNKGLTGPVLQNGYGVRNAGDAAGTAKVRLLATAAPVSGTYEVGDIVYNSAPTAGGTIGWVCTTAGTPGTWKTWGAISA